MYKWHELHVGVVFTSSLTILFTVRLKHLIGELEALFFVKTNS